MSFDESDYRIAEESDASEAAERAFVDGYAQVGAPLSSEERDVASAAWSRAWSAGAVFERRWSEEHPPRATIDEVYENVVNAHSIQEVVEYARSRAEYCCENGCGSGACESCVCCGAGFCVGGSDGVPEDADDRARWLFFARGLNPVADALAEALGMSGEDFALSEENAPTDGTKP